MPKIKFIVVGNTRSSFLKQGEVFYLERLRRYAPTEWIEVKPQKVSKGRSREEILKAECLSIEKKYLPDDHIIALDLKGKEYDSKGLATLVEQLLQTSKRLCFVVGGPLGLSKKVLDTASHIVSLSKMTLTHEMSRLVLLEQVYRAHTIINGEKYHK
jgi:23S rRNA (pseudouridine1915-N3)-methyltransferase